MRFTTLEELGELIPVDCDTAYFNLSKEELDIYIGMLGWAAQEYLNRTGDDPKYRGVKLIVNAKD